MKELLRLKLLSDRATLSDRARFLDALTFADPSIRERVRRKDGNITHDELMERLNQIPRVHKQT